MSANPMNPLDPDSGTPSTLVRARGVAGSGVRGAAGSVECAAGLSAALPTRPAPELDTPAWPAITDLDVDALTGWMVWRALQPDILAPTVYRAVSALASAVGSQVDDAEIWALSASLAADAVDAARSGLGGPSAALPESCCTQGIV